MKAYWTAVVVVDSTRIAKVVLVYMYVVELVYWVESMCLSWLEYTCVLFEDMLGENICVDAVLAGILPVVGCYAVVGGYGAVGWSAVG